MLSVDIIREVFFARHRGNFFRLVFPTFFSDIFSWLYAHKVFCVHQVLDNNGTSEIFWIRALQSGTIIYPQMKNIRPTN